MTRLLVALSPEEIDALDRLMADRGDYLPGVARQRARATGPFLLHAAQLATDNKRLRGELERCRRSESGLDAGLDTERKARREAEARRDQALKALRAARDEHARTRRRLRNARAAIVRLRTSRDLLRR